MIYGECQYNGTPVLNVRWPHRIVWKVWGRTEGGQSVGVYVLDDCSGDAIESVLEWAGEEWSDGAELEVTRVKGEERSAVLNAADAAAEEIP